MDNTTGTAVLTAASVRSAVGLASANLDTQLSGLSSGQSTINSNVSSRLAASSYTAPPSAATNATAVRSELATELGRIDATVSSRLAASDYTTPPSASSIATAVWAAATRTLTTAIDNSATIAAAVWSYATGRTITGGTVDTLTNAPTVPTPSQIASQVRTEMDSNSTKLANLDATVSSRSTYDGSDTSGTTTLLSRLTSTRAGYLDNIASAADIATAVWAAATRTLTTTFDSASSIAAAVWAAASRTITGGTVDTLTNAPSVPSAATIASQVRTELGTELGRIDAAVSSRLAPADTLARVTLVDTTTTLTNAPDVPTEGDIAAAVWTAIERTVTGGTVDSVTNSTPVDAEEIAAAVRTELTPELERVANCATVETTGDQIAGLQ